MPNKEQSETRKCIYCLREKPKSNFNKEHVLQKSFGKYRGALTLTEQVCKACNASFGNEMDRILGRDSFETLYRLRYGMNSHKEIGDDITCERLTPTISKEGQADWAGAKVEVALDPYHHYLTARALPQLGFVREGSRDYVYFTLSELEKGLHFDRLDVDKKAGVKIISNKKEDWDKLTSFLNKMGMPVESTREFVPIQPIQTDDGKVPVQVQFNIDNVLVRGIAKVGFNYMAKMCGTAFALKEDFNTLRQFIRYGKLPSGELRETIEPSNQPFLANDSFNYRRLGHLLILEWDITRRHVLVRVSLFNSITWTIMLAKYFSGIFREIKSCHFYDIQNRLVRRLPVFSRELMP